MATNLDKALEKIRECCPFEDLPLDRNDGLWKELTVNCGLLFPELSALKNRRCPLQGCLVTVKVFL